VYEVMEASLLRGCRAEPGKIKTSCPALAYIGQILSTRWYDIPDRRDRTTGHCPEAPASTVRLKVGRLKRKEPTRTP